ncbi:hypothetical protein [Saliniramus sp.]|uniref:hypothetical protein n=1 Tax=Saliniramus sp. TaxID=2986772 RepID=UPI002C001DC0|nr:hypothetical protein [Saliniramus sp.]HMB09019.1 hypothetical protein [Saliniramus sp.]
MIDAKTNNSGEMPTTGDAVADSPSLATFIAALTDCFEIPPEQLEQTLLCCSAEKLATFLAGNHDSAVKLRKLLQLDPARIDAAELAVALSQPAGHVCRAVFETLDRMARIAIDPETVLVTRMRHTKQCILAAWDRAIDLVAPAGYIAQEEAYDLGIGSQVYAAMAARYGKTDIEALSHGEFLALAPRLIEFWPVSEDGLKALTDMLYELEDVIELHSDAQFMAIMRDAAE